MDTTPHHPARLHDRQVAEIARGHQTHAGFHGVGKVYRHGLNRHDVSHSHALRVQARQQHLDGAIALSDDAFQALGLKDQYRANTLVPHQLQDRHDRVVRSDADEHGGLWLLFETSLDGCHGGSLWQAAW